MQPCSQKPWAFLNQNATVTGVLALAAHLLALSAFAQTNWPGALAISDAIDLNGCTLLVDSFDSSNPSKSTSGQYDPTKYAGDNGDVVTLGGILDRLNIGSASVYGHAYTSSGTNTMAIGPGDIGSHSWQAAHSGIEPGWWLQSAKLSFPNIPYPNTSAFLIPTAGVWATASSTNFYDHILLILSLRLASAVTSLSLEVSSPFGHNWLVGDKSPLRRFGGLASGCILLLVLVVAFCIGLPAWQLLPCA